MKRFTALILALVLAVSLAACGDAQQASSRLAAPSSSSAPTEAPEPETESEEATEEEELVEGEDYLTYYDEANGVLLAYPLDFTPEGEADEFGYMSFVEEGGTATMLYWATPNTYDEDIAAFMDRNFSFEPQEWDDNIVIGMGESADQRTGETIPAAFIWLVEPGVIANVMIACTDMDEAAAWFDRLAFGDFALAAGGEGGVTEDVPIEEGEPAYWDGLDFGPNLVYAEEYASEADPGPFPNAAEAAKETFDAMKANDNIPGYSDDLTYTMTLVDITDIEGEGCYVYRLDADEPGGTVGAAYAYAYGSAAIYMQGMGGAWVIPA